ncbi:hypothetical protein, partial [Endozoicomonas acroporae]|uniref:hypothetical protein n=1 Tax=Endozoicomonas acroporae TaxID=1701104 RepID=UPI003D79781C
MGDLDDEYKTVENPLIHDKRGFLARGDRDIYYPNDPNFIPVQNGLDTNRLEAIKTQLAGVQKTLVDKV